MFRSKMSSSMSSSTLPAVKTESITKTTFTETTVKRVTSSAVVEQVALKRSGGPLGLSIIGGSDHSCVPFGTGEQVREEKLKKNTYFQLMGGLVF